MAKKKMRKYGVFAGIMLLGVSSLTGCGKETPKSLLAKMVDNMSSLKSYNMGMVMDMDASGSVMGMTLAMGMGMDMNMDITTDPQRVHGTGQVSVDILGQNQNMDMEMYVIPEGEEVVSYVGTDGAWIKEEAGTVRRTLKAYEFQELGSLSDSLELADETKEEEGKECYVLSGKVDEKLLEDMLGMVMDSMDTEGLDLEAEDLEDARFDFQLYIEKEKKYPVKMAIDIQPFMEAALNASEEEGVEFTCDTCKFVCTFGDFDAIDAIELPDEVKESAVLAEKIE